MRRSLDASWLIFSVQKGWRIEFSSAPKMADDTIISDASVRFLSKPGTVKFSPGFRQIHASDNSSSLPSLSLDPQFPNGSSESKAQNVSLTNSFPVSGFPESGTIDFVYEIGSRSGPLLVDERMVVDVDLGLFAKKVGTAFLQRYPSTMDGSFRQRVSFCYNNLATQLVGLFVFKLTFSIQARITNLVGGDFWFRCELSIARTSLTVKTVQQFVSNGVLWPNYFNHLPFHNEELFGET